MNVRAIVESIVLLARLKHNYLRVEK